MAAQNHAIAWHGGWRCLWRVPTAWHGNFVVSLSDRRNHGLAAQRGEVRMGFFLV